MSRLESMRRRLSAQIDGLNWAAEFVALLKGDVLGAHQANWEWSISIPLYVDIQCFGAYTRIGNKYFDKAVKDSRTKFGFIGYKTTETMGTTQSTHTTPEIKEPSVSQSNVVRSLAVDLCGF